MASTSPYTSIFRSAPLKETQLKLFTSSLPKYLDVYVGVGVWMNVDDHAFVDRVYIQVYGTRTASINKAEPILQDGGVVYSLNALVRPVEKFASNYTSVFLNVHSYKKEDLQMRIGLKIAAV